MGAETRNADIDRPEAETAASDPAASTASTRCPSRSRVVLSQPAMRLARTCRRVGHQAVVEPDASNLGRATALLCMAMDWMDVATAIPLHPPWWRIMGAR